MSSQEQEMVVEVLKRLQSQMEELQTTEHEARKIMDDVECRDEMVSRAIHDVSLQIRALDNRIDVWNTHAGKLKELEDKVVMLQGLYSRLTMADPIEPRVAKTEQEILEAQDFHEYCEVTLDEHAGRIEGVERWLENVEGRLVGAGIK